MKYFVLILFIILTLVKIYLCQIVEPTRTIDLWHPFGTSTTRKPGTAPKEDEVIVRLAIGDIVGKKNYLFDLPWTVNHDPSEVTNPELGERDPNPVPPYNNATIFSFLGLPYAMPPVSERRFKPPQQLVVLPGDSPYLAFDYRPSCAQDVESRQKVFINEPYPYLTDEDCLYLNVFTPEASKSSNLFYPVVVFFHGGNFQTGSGNEWPGHVLASRGLVVVTVNYRLGAFGFMSLGDEKTSNFGIKDQRMALQWVQQYIAAFGGDNQAVTIIGHDAGAVSAGIHMLSEESKGLFRGVVAMSGAEVSYHSIIGKAVLAYNNTIKLGRYLGCTQAVAENVWDCILQRSSDDIVEALSPAGNPPVPIEFNRYMFMPSIDGRELKAHPLWLLQNVGSGNVNIASAVPYLTGLNQHDGSEIILEDRTLGEFTNFLEVDHAYQQSWVYEYSFRHNYTMNREAIAEAIDNFYTFWPDPADVWKIREKFIELTTDTYYTAPISLSAHLHSATGSRTFMYVNNYNFSKTRENTPSQKYFPPWMGTCHECDLYLLFGFPFMPRKLLPKHFQPIEWYETDRNASYLFGAFVRQFIKKSDPNLPFTGLWPAHQPRAHWYADFNYTYGASVATVGEIKRDYRYQEVAFWNNYIPALVNYMTTTFPPWEVRERRQVVTMTIITIVLAIVLLVVTVIALSLAYCVCNREERRRFLYKQHFVRIQENNQSTQQLEMDRMSSL
uniref:Carboxylesterase type B domain-containing protein n=1 Tax=Panagrolaimus sp. PS1159 TaxID=55785 RepID=A0AC35EZ91_9BILA